ncbi:guanitoxin biosynthesis heme-dependent pre-guanitoxin N-hydroxylase GntA [uncultured Cyclobacterium sp.]|uniref:guanitoxin biosynthesis heme-dependent pre-guanitoxin N-hydroxylase GntA n=1 Tax=uncultured Cyclobacterium sp. TaxID=453820 RepID=UPI0030EC4944|tara:strand:+ start:49502 stop:50191 length:690 start_codon:yes stop_codon:yes gene_type:complete
MEPTNKNPKSGPKPLEIKQELEEFIIENEHPCIMANAVFKLNNFELNLFDKLASRTTAGKMLNAIKTYLSNYQFNKNTFKSFIAVFPQSEVDSEEEFEKLLWKQLQYIHEIDEQPWDPNVSSDPENANFSFSIAGHAFYVVGMHPHSSRMARRSAYPTLVFNLHSQFEKLREMNAFRKVRDKIRARDIAFQGYINPVLKDYGDNSEAIQYSGRNTAENWKCPFHSKSEF